MLVKVNTTTMARRLSFRLQSIRSWIRPENLLIRSAYRIVDREDCEG